MPRPVRPWFRLYTEMFSDRKMRRLTPEERWIWVSILGAARESPRPPDLYISADIPMTVGELADYADVKVKAVQKVLPIMVSLGMMTIRGGVMTASNFSARQYESDNVTARTRAYRERSKDEEGTFQPSSREQPKNGRRNVPETETETETDKKTSMPRKRGTRLPENWKPSRELRDRLAAKYPGIDLHNEWEKFTDYWQAKAGKDAAKLDWDATFRSWIRNAAERQPRYAQPTKDWQPPEQPPDDVFSEPGAYERWIRDQSRRPA